MHGTQNIVAGGAICALGVAMALGASSFPTIPAMDYGPGFYPTIVAIGLIISGVGVAFEGISKKSRPEFPEVVDLIRIASIAALIAGFALSFTWLGFHISAIIALAIATKLFGGSWGTAIPFALIAATALHVLFYSMLRVPLPWGLLLPVAW